MQYSYDREEEILGDTGFKMCRLSALRTLRWESVLKSPRDQLIKMIFKRQRGEKKNSCINFQHKGNLS